MLDLIVGNVQHAEINIFVQTGYLGQCVVGYVELFQIRKVGKAGYLG